MASPLRPMHRGRNPQGVPSRYQLPGGQNQQGEGPLQVWDCPIHRLLHTAAGQPLLGDGVGDNLCVAGGLEDGAVVLVLGAQRLGVYQIAVVDHGQGSLDIGQGQRLSIFPFSLSRGGIANMAHRPWYRSLVQNIRVKDVTDQTQIFIVGQLPVIGHRNTAGLLAAVL